MIDWAKVITVEDKFQKAKEAKKASIAQTRYEAEIAGGQRHPHEQGEPTHYDWDGFKGYARP